MNSMAASMCRLMLASQMQNRLLSVFPQTSSLGVGFHCTPVCCRKTKHWNPKFKKERREKVIKIELPDYDKLRKEQNMTPEEIRAKMKEKGVIPARPWTERPIIISCTASVFEPYIPPEGDGKMSAVSVMGAKQKLQWMEKKGKTVMALRKLRTFDEDFEVAVFSEKAQEIYIAAHNALAEKDEDKLHELVTESCFPEMMLNIHRKTIKWQFIKSLEIPRISHVRCTDIISKENVYAQVTVRLHSQQILAVYDRFGRLMHGSEAIAKDVLEYVVFEKHLANQYGLWRIHAKIIPDWMPPKDPVALTYRQIPFEEPPPETTEKTSKKTNEATIVPSAATSQQPSAVVT